jgi:hypothetical protein
MMEFILFAFSAPILVKHVVVVQMHAYRARSVLIEFMTLFI